MFLSLPEAVEYGRKLVRDGKANHDYPANVGWVKDGSKVIWYALPPGFAWPEGFVHSLLLPNGLD